MFISTFITIFFCEGSYFGCEGLNLPETTVILLKYFHHCIPKNQDNDPSPWEPISFIPYAPSCPYTQARYRAGCFPSTPDQRTVSWNIGAPLVSCLHGQSSRTASRTCFSHFYGRILPAKTHFYGRISHSKIHFSGRIARQSEKNVKSPQKYKVKCPKNTK